MSPSKHKTFYNICTMVGERRRPWADVVQMLYDCFVFTGSSHKGLFDLNILCLNLFFRDRLTVMDIYLRNSV